MQLITLICSTHKMLHLKMTTQHYHLASAHDYITPGNIIILKTSKRIQDQVIINHN